MRNLWRNNKGQGLIESLAALVIVAVTALSIPTYVSLTRNFLVARNRRLAAVTVRNNLIGLLARNDSFKQMVNDTAGNPDFQCFFGGGPAPAGPYTATCGLIGACLWPPAACVDDSVNKILSCGCVDNASTCQLSKLRYSVCTNSQAIYSDGNGRLVCDAQSCFVGGARNIVKIHDPLGGTYYDSSAANNGFTDGARPCPGAPSADCPIQPVITWTPIGCTNNTCVTWLIKVNVTFNMPNAAPAINPNMFSFELIRPVPL